MEFVHEIVQVNINEHIKTTDPLWGESPYKYM